MPPSSSGALHSSWIRAVSNGVAARLVGRPGTVPLVVAWATSDAGPEPASLIADTR